MRPSPTLIRWLTLLCTLLATACGRDFLDASAFGASDASGADADGGGSDGGSADAAADADGGPTDGEDAGEIADIDAVGEDTGAADALGEDAETADAVDVGDSPGGADGEDGAAPADTTPSLPPPCQGGAGGLYSVALDPGAAQRALAAAVAVPTGGLIAVGRSAPGKNGGTDVLWVRVGVDGKLVSLQEIGGTGDEELHGLAPLDDGGAIAVGERKNGAGTVDALWMRLDAAGGVLLQKEIANAEGPDRLYDVAAAVNGESVAVGVRSVTGGSGGDAGQGHVVGIDGAGNVAWSFVAGGKGEDALAAVARDAGGSIAVGHRAGGATAWAVRHDAAGGLLWQRTYEGFGAGGARLYAATLAAGATGDAFAAGDRRTGPGAGAEGLLVRLDGNGRVRWFWTTTANGGLTFSTLVQRSGGELVALGTAGGVGARTPWMATATPLDGLLTPKSLDALRPLLPGTSKPAADVPLMAGLRLGDDGLAMVGAAREGAVSAAWLARVDAFGAADCGQSGLCAAAPAACDDGKACTQGLCSPSSGCTQVPFAGACDDKQPCTALDACVASTCKGGSPALFDSKGAVGSHAGLRALVVRASAGTFAVGEQVGANNVVQAKLERRDALGAIVASALRGDVNIKRAAHAAAEWPDGSLAVIGGGSGASDAQDAWVERVGPDLGAPMWSQTFGSAGEQVAWAGALDAQGLLRVVGHSGAAGSSAGLTARFDVAGVVSDVETLSSGGDQALRAVLAHGGDLWACGWRAQQVGGKADMWLQRFGPDGKQGQSLLVGEPEFDERCLAISRRVGGWVLGGTVANDEGGTAGLVVATDEAGKALWQSALGSSGVNAYFGVLGMSDGRVFAVGSQQHDAPALKEGWLVPIGPTGQYLAELYAGGPGEDAIAAIALDRDGALLLAGHRGGEANKTVEWLEKRDPWANTSCGKGACYGTSFASCDDANPCTQDSCDPDKGCVHSTFADGTWCGGVNGDDACHAGKCLAVPSGKIYHPTGSFWMGKDGQGDAAPAHLVQISAFLLDRHEVKVADYKACVDAAKCEPPKVVWATSQALCNYGRAGAEAHPVNGVTWDQAVQYCAFAGGRLPTEAEWEFAARNRCPDNTDLPGCQATQHTYPWGEAPASCAYAVLAEGGKHGCGLGTTAGVGSKADGESGLGVRDLIGNVWEWTADYYGGSYYANSPAKDPKGPAAGTTRVLRGSSFFAAAADPPAPEAWRRKQSILTTAGHSIGFRCAKDVP